MVVQKSNKVSNLISRILLLIIAILIINGGLTVFTLSYVNAEYQSLLQNDLELLSNSDAIQINLLTARRMEQEFIKDANDSKRFAVVQNVDEIVILARRIKEIDSSYTWVCDNISQNVGFYKSEFSTVISKLKTQGTGGFYTTDRRLGTIFASLELLENLVEVEYSLGNINASIYSQMDGILQTILNRQNSYLLQLNTSKNQIEETLFYSSSLDQFTNLVGQEISNSTLLSFLELEAEDLMASLESFLNLDIDLTQDLAELEVFSLNIGFYSTLMNNEMQESVNVRRSSLDATNSLISIVMSMFTVLAIIISVFLAFYMNKRIISPIGAFEKDIIRMSEGDLTVDLKASRQTSSELSSFNQSFSKMQQKFLKVVSSVQKSSKITSVTAKELLAGLKDVNLQSEEISESVQQISHGASSQAELSSLSLQKVENLSDNVTQTIDDVDSALTLIEDIARQTNLLALNAAIEASRAGEFGRGFAVVADNVQRLAEETKKNASEISQLTAKIVSNIGKSITDLTESFRSFAVQSEEFSAITEEVAASSEEQIAAVTQMVLSANTLNVNAEELNELVLQFTTESKE